LLDNYTKLCTIEADLSQAVSKVTRLKAKGKGSFYRVYYDIILLFGTTELKAHVAWKVNVSDLHVVPSNRARVNICAWLLERRETVGFIEEIVFLS
jgi:hypothetical protein